MTRLITEWLEGLEEELKKYDARLTGMIGMDISSLAFRAAGMRAMPKDELRRHKAAVIRMTSGEGVIGCFAESVAAVISHMGAEAFIPEGTDVAGIHEAMSKGAEILFMADDERFVALNVKAGTAAENDSATAQGYTAALSAMADGLADKEVLLLGYGRLGQKALGCLLAAGASVNVYDRDATKTAKLHCMYGEKKVKILSDLPLPLSGLVFDATDEGGYLNDKDISKNAKIAAPGIPLSLDGGAYLAHHDKVMHDPLQTGVAVMLAETLWGAVRMEHMDPKSMQPGETPGLLAIN